MTGISVGDYRDPERGLELGDLMREVAAVDGRRARAPVVGRGDPRARLAARRACGGAAHLPAPARAAPVRATTRVLASMGRNYDSAGYLEAIARLRERVPHVNLTTDVIVGYPTEDEAAFERTLDARAGGRHHAGAHVQLLGPAGNRGRPPRRPGAARREEAPQPRAARAVGGARRAATARRSSARVEEVLVDKVADTQASGYSRDYTRYYLPPGVAARGRHGARRARRSSTPTASPAWRPDGPPPLPLTRVSITERIQADLSAAAKAQDRPRVSRAAAADRRPQEGGEAGARRARRAGRDRGAEARAQAPRGGSRGLPQGRPRGRGRGGGGRGRADRRLPARADLRRRAPGGWSPTRSRRPARSRRRRWAR